MILNIAISLSVGISGGNAPQQSILRPYIHYSETLLRSKVPKINTAPFGPVHGAEYNHVLMGTMHMLIVRSWVLP